MAEVESWEKWIWSESFWLPPNVTWADLKQDENIFVPKASDLWLPLPIAVGLFILRLLWERYIALPLGRYFNIREVPPRRPICQPVLEDSYIANRRNLPSHQVVQELATQISWTPRQVERWWRRRRVQGKPSEMQRWRETSWRFTFYLTIFWYGVVVLWDKPWFWNTTNCWHSYPKQHVETEIWAYYMIELGFYFSLFLSLFMDTKRKDFSEQLLHHFCTISLMLFSYSTNMLRIGAVILLCHDVADSWLEGAKLAKYAKFHKLCDVLFVVFAVVWFITRLCIYPIKVLWTVTLEGHHIVGGLHGAYLLEAILLYVLLILNIIWFCLICRVLYMFLTQGKVEKDERSETEPETNSEDEDIIAKNGGGEHMNGFDSRVINNNVKAKKMD